MDHIYLPIITTLGLAAFGGGFTLLLRWSRHVDKSLCQIWAEIKAERLERQKRWEGLHRDCMNHNERIARLEGRLDKDNQ